MPAVTDCESSYPPSCTALLPSIPSSLSHIFLSSGFTVSVTPSVSPLSPVHIESTLVSPIHVSLIPSPSSALGLVELASPQHQPIAARCAASHTQAAFISVPTTYPVHTHTAQSQNTHPPTNGSSQPLTQVIITAIVRQI